MARHRSSFVSLMNQMAREAERARRSAEIEQRRIARENERLQRAIARNLVKMEKAERERYLLSRQNETDRLTEEIGELISSFSALLLASTRSSHRISFHKFYRNEPFRVFTPPKLNVVPKPVKPDRSEFVDGLEPKLLENLLGIGRNKRLKRLERAEVAFQEAVKQFEKEQTKAAEFEQENQKKLANARNAYEQAKQEYLNEQKRHNDEVDNLISRYRSADQEAVEYYIDLVLDVSHLKEQFPHDYKLFFTPETNELVMEYELPDLSVVPTVKSYKFVKTKDEIRGTDFKPKERHEVYSKLVASTSLCVLYELFESDQADVVKSIVFNGFVSTTDPTTGLNIRPCVITIQAVKDTFMQFDLSKVDPVACVK